MKKILLSLLTVGLVSAAAIFVTSAYFSDTEENLGNSIQAGTIDISVDGENPWTSTETMDIANMLPGETNSMEQQITNVGNRELVLWKRVTITDRNTGNESEPECYAEGGTWVNSIGPCNGETEINDMDSYMAYGMEVDLGSGYFYNIDPAWDVKMSDVDTLWVPLGRLDPLESIKVRQTYALDEDAGNAYQGDQLIFDVTYYAEQLDAPGPIHTTGGVIMDNKTTATEWAPIVGDGTFAILQWDGSGIYNLRAWGLSAANYRLRAWDAASDSDLGFFSTPQAPSAGQLNFTGTNASLNSYSGAKIWLQDSATWDNSLSLWESNLINY
jgi:predicted ribosomally synthesized peptide with SipW-like signal peptide